MSVNDLVLNFTLRLLAAAEEATVERGKAIIARVFSEVAADPDFHLGKAAKKRADRERQKLVSTLTRQFLEAIEQPQCMRVREMLDRELASSGQGTFSSSETTAFAPSALPARRRIRRSRPNPRLPPPLDPEQIKRDREFARLRALLKPVPAEPLAPLPAPEVAAPTVQPQRPASPGEILRALEKEIQNAVPALGALGPEMCSAQIAVWVGQARGLRDRLPPDVSAAMRPAFRIFLEHLEQLCVQMEAHVVDALEQNWKAPDWDAYVEVNRARIEQRAPALSADRLQLHHRAMLRALVLPHRRNVPEHAKAIIDAAAEALPPDDSLLQSAIRRHSRAWQAPASPPPEDSPAAPPAADASPVAPTGEDTLDELAPEVPKGAPDEKAGDAPGDPATSESEFDRPWTK